MDMEANREVKREQGIRYAKEKGIPFFETSAFDGTNIKTVFVTIL